MGQIVKTQHYIANDIYQEAIQTPALQFEPKAKKQGTRTQLCPQQATEPTRSVKKSDFRHILILLFARYILSLQQNKSKFYTNERPKIYDARCFRVKGGCS